MRILHLAERANWVDAQRSGEYRWSTRGVTLEQAGYLHASTSAQLPGVIDSFYADADLSRFLVLVIDIDSCAETGSAVRWDAVGDTFFPHVYGPLRAQSVVAALPLSRDARHVTVLPDLAGLEVAVDPPA